MSKKIVISGWYGFGNIGDEAILQAMIDTFIKEYPNCKITVLSYNPNYTKKTQKVNAVYQIPIHGVKTWIKNILLLRWIKTLKVIKECDLFVMGGGGFLSDWQPEVPKGWLKQMKLAKLFGKNTMLYGIGAGPFLTKKGKITTKYYIDSYVDSIIVRDRESYRQLKENVGVSQEIQVVIDPVATMDVQRYINRVENSDNSIALIYTEYFNNKHFDAKNKAKWNLLFKAYCSQVEAVINQGYKVNLVFFQKEIEYGLANKFREIFVDKVNIYFPNDYKDAITILYRSEAIISFRLHGNILAYALKKPFLPIIYHHKTDGFLEHIEYPYKDLILEVGDGLNWQDKEICANEWYKKTFDFLEKIKNES